MHVTFLREVWKNTKGSDSRKWSSRMETLSGLRMMPPFPPSPLKFRTVGFPQYGFKAGISNGAFPSSLSLKPAPGIHDRLVGLHPSLHGRGATSFVPLRVGRMILDHATVRARALPQGSSLRS